MTAAELHLVVPGSLAQNTGGYLYDARIVNELRQRAWRVTVHNLEGAFPVVDNQARASITQTLEACPDGARVVIDGLALAGFADLADAHSSRLRILGLIHHPLAEETGLADQTRQQLATREREALTACRGVVVTSAFTAKQMDAYGVPTSSVRVVSPGNDPARLAQGPTCGDPPSLLCVASVIPRKGHEVLIRALARLREISWTCVCVGSLTRAPTHAALVQEQARTNGLSGRICFPGECSTDVVKDFYHTSSVFVLPSHYEGFGLVLVEAMARGLPIVSTTAGAIPSTVPPDTGMLVEPGNPELLAGALRALLAGEAGQVRRNMLGAAARRHASSLPSWDQAGRVFAAAILELAPDES